MWADYATPPPRTLRLNIDLLSLGPLISVNKNNKKIKNVKIQNPPVKLLCK